MAVDSGSYTDATLQSRRRLAEAMMQKGMDTSPISSHWQGLARIANSVMGGYDLHKLDSEAKALEESARKERVAAMGLGEVEKQAASLTPPAPSMTQTTDARGGPGDFMDFVRKQEGFTPTPKWDYNQSSIGYGTKALPGETSITREEAEKRLGTEVGQARQLVQSWAKSNGITLSPARENALTDLTYNAGTKWMASGLGQAVQAGDWNAARDRFLQYNQAGGKVLPGLVSRRQAAAGWLGDASMPVDPMTEGGLPVPPSAAGQSMPPVAGQSMPPVATQQVAQAPGATMTDAPASALPPNAAQIKLLLNSRDKKNQALGMEMLKEWRAQQAKANNPTDEIREYALDIKQRRAAGEKDLPTFGKWKADLKRAGATQVSVINRGETEFDKTIGKKMGEDINTIQDAGRAARTQLYQLDSVEDALNTYTSGAKFGTGALGKSELALRQYARALGVGDADTVGAGELVTTIQNRMTLALRSTASGEGMPGALSNDDRKFLTAAQPGLDKTPEGNRRIIGMMRKLEQRKIEVSKLAAQYLKENKDFRGWEEHLQEWADKNPLFPPPKPTASPPPGARLKFNPATGELE